MVVVCSDALELFFEVEEESLPCGVKVYSNRVATSANDFFLAQNKPTT
jgi:hypothetical protein